MRKVTNGKEHFSRTSWIGRAGSGLVLLAAVMVMPLPAGAQAPAPEGQAAAEPAQEPAKDPVGLPPSNWRSSPHHAVIDGWGRTIPCRCRFNGKAYKLGEIVCMKTHVGTVLTRCDIFENNTSWIPSRQPCEPDAGT